MPRLHIALTLLPLTFFPTAALAQQAANGVAVEAADSNAFITGLSPGDQLNIREKPSPLGKTIARLPNGALVSRLECEVVEGYEWCKVDALDVEEATGWAPARYLQGLDDVSLDTAEADDEADLTSSDMEARFAGAEPAPIAEAASGDASGEAQDGEEHGAGVPVPTPRPGSPASQDAGESRPDELALATPATGSRHGKAAGEIPCAREVGEPMGRCVLMADRRGEAAVDVTVVWPDGGTRRIEFRDGVPTGSDAADAVRVTREGTLNMIRIGAAERFEILDALALGN